MKKGKQQFPFERCQFNFNFLAGFELLEHDTDYWPVVFVINHTDHDKKQAQISYGVFTQDGDEQITGVHIEKQIVIVSSGLNAFLDKRPALRAEEHLWP